MKRIVACVLIGFLATLYRGPAVASTKVDVANELERLAATHGFEIKPEHLEKTRNHQGRAEFEALMPRLRELLSSFDHIIVQKPGGGIERVLILGETAQNTPPSKAPASGGGTKQPGGDKQGGKGEPADGSGTEEDGDIVLSTQRKGTQHMVQVALEGADGNKVNHQFLIDTGADHVVLPTSLLEILKIPEASLQPTQAQTANGKVDARIGLLNAVWLGERRIVGVIASFIEDDKLGGNALLGMSVLSRYKMTIDDEKNTLTLSKK